MKRKIDIIEFKKKVKIEKIGFDMSEEGLELSQKGDGLISFAVSKKDVEAIYSWCKEQGVLELAICGVKFELSPYRNFKILINFSDKDKEELWR